MNNVNDDFFTIVNTCVEVPPHQGIFDPREFYRDIGNLIIHDSFRDWIPKYTSPISHCPGAIFTSQDLKKAFPDAESIFDSEIIQYLGLTVGDLNKTLCHLSKLVLVRRRDWQLVRRRDWQRVWESDGLSYERENIFYVVSNSSSAPVEVSILSAQWVEDLDFYAHWRIDIEALDKRDYSLFWKGPRIFSIK